MKLVFKILLALIVVIIATLVALPFLLEKNIDKIIHHATDGKLNAELSYTDIDLSLIKRFPKAYVDVKDFKLLNKAPFKNDTLFYAGDIKASFSFMQLFKDTDSKALKIDKIRLDDAIIKIITNTKGEANYDIAIPNDASETPKEQTADKEGSSPFELNLDYEINNTKFVYLDSVSHVYVQVDKLYHSGKGNVSAAITDLDTKTDLELSYAMGGIEYTHDMPINLRALIAVDLENQKYTFKENEGHLNQIPLQFEGWVQMLDDATDMDLSFKSGNASFKHLLASIPNTCLLYTSPSPRDGATSRMPSSA